jgi:hypothetical protein
MGETSRTEKTLAVTRAVLIRSGSPDPDAFISPFSNAATPGERTGLPLKVEHVRRRHWHVALTQLGDALLDQDQSIRMVIRQRSKQNGVDHTENRGIRADADGERDNRNRGKTRIRAQSAEGVAKVLEESLHGLISKEQTLIRRT